MFARTSSAAVAQIAALSSLAAIRLLVLPLIIAGLSGCDGVQRPPLNPVRTQTPDHNQPGLDAANAGLELPGAEFKSKWETWDAYFVRDRQVGYIHIAADLQTEDKQQVVYQVNHQFNVRRGTSTLIQRLSQLSTETVDGRLSGFESRRHVGPLVTEIRGDVDAGVLKVETSHGKDRTNDSIPWKPDVYRGLVGIEQSLRRNPIAEGETRVFKMPMLFAGNYTIATVRLRCGAEASVPMIDGRSKKLLEIENEIHVADQLIESVMWADRQGNTLRTYSPAHRMFGYRVDRKTATAVDGEVEPVHMLAFDVEGSLTDRGSLSWVAYRLTPSDAVRRGGGEISLEPAPGQVVRAMPDGSRQVLVGHQAEKMGADMDKGFAASLLQPSDEDRQPNELIDCNEPLIRRLADLTLSGEQNLSDRRRALALSETVRRQLQERTEVFNGFRPASQLGEAGDSTDHAVLLMALLRSQQIPARLASGLVYEGGDAPRMRYHSWTLAFVDGTWLPLDATTGSVAAPDRITFGTTNLGDGKWYASIQPIIDAVGRVDVAIVRAK